MPDGVTLPPGATRPPVATHSSGATRVPGADRSVGPYRPPKQPGHPGPIMLQTRTTPLMYKSHGHPWHPVSPGHPGPLGHTVPPIIRGQPGTLGRPIRGVIPAPKHPGHPGPTRFQTFTSTSMYDFPSQGGGTMVGHRPSTSRCLAEGLPPSGELAGAVPAVGPGCPGSFGGRFADFN